MLFDLVTLYIGAGFGLFGDVKEPTDTEDAEDAEVYDLAGNVFDLPSPRVDLIVNTATPLGFLVTQLRLSGDYAKDRSIIDAGRALDAAVEGLKTDLTPCVNCGQINGNHRAICPSVTEMITMNWVSKELKERNEDGEG